MHRTALLHGKLFFDAYVAPGARIMDLGSQDVNGSLRSVAPESSDYVGVDFAEGRGVDVVISDPYNLPFEDSEFDVCVSSSCYEHSEFFWLSFLEVLRILKPGGLLYLSVPSNGPFHRYPVDCWRFYPDSGVALEHWGRRNGHEVDLLESFIGNRRTGQWNDFVAVFAKGGDHPNRIQASYSDFSNGYSKGREGYLHFNEIPQDQRPIRFWWRIRSLLGRPIE
jgi:SAM-dependent methyltransferase